MLADRAVAEQRVLPTQDRGLLHRRAVFAEALGALVRGAGTAAQLDDVLDRFAPPLVPWTRCPTCGGLLEPASGAQVAPMLERGTRCSYRDFARCLECGQVYWRGAHAARLEPMVARAEKIVQSRLRSPRTSRADDRAQS